MFMQSYPKTPETRPLQIEFRFPDQRFIQRNKTSLVTKPYSKGNVYSVYSEITAAIVAEKRMARKNDIG